MNEYEGAWITTFSGKKFHYLNPQPEEINIKDIAHHLSLICRFTGATREFYSVAEHSIRVAEHVPPSLRLSALLHDASEAYLNDISRPVKHSCMLKATEEGISKAVASKFGTVNDNLIVKYYDSVLLATEARDLMPNTNGWAGLPEPLDEIISPWTADDAEKSFLTYFVIYGGIE